MPTLATRFVTAPDGGRIAYQVVGEGSREILLVGDWLSSIDLMWEYPPSARLLDSLSELGRLVLVDKRGSGGSDPASFHRGAMGATMEQGAADLATVLDAVGSDETDIVTTSTGLWPALMLSATAPTRVRRLVAHDPAVLLVNTDDYPYAMTHEALALLIDNIEQHWGEGTSLLYYAPDEWADIGLREWLGRYERLATTRTFMLETWRHAAEADIRPVLPLVQAEALVLSHTDNRMLSAEQGRYLANHLRSARFVALDGSNMFTWGDQRVATHIHDFLGEDSNAPRDVHRVLATILFTDIVDSTSQLALLGDRRWRQLLDEHDLLGANLVDRFQGRVVKRTGDGLLAVFDGPARAVRCATALTEAAHRRLGVELRAGLHTGEVELRGDDVGGMSVHLAARVMADARGGEVLTTRTVKDLTTGSRLSYSPLGVRELKGVPESWELYSVTG